MRQRNETRLWLLFLLVILAITLISLAFMDRFIAKATDTPPPALTIALNHLSLLVGKALTIDDLQAWQVIPRTFRNTSLNCERLGFAYLQMAVPGYQVFITYHNTVFDYREGLRQVFICTLSFI